MNMRCTLTQDGRLFAKLLDKSGKAIAEGVFDSGEEAEAAARLYLKQLEKEAHGVEDTDQTRSVTVPG
jgi:hypothetical protein